MEHDRRRIIARETIVSRTAEGKDNISDLQFTEAYRAPCQFRRLAREYLGAGTFVLSLSGVALTDLDGDCFYDLTGRRFCPVQPLSLSRRAAPDGKKHGKSPGRGDWFRALRRLRQ